MMPTTDEVYQLRPTGRQFLGMLLGVWAILLKAPASIIIGLLLLALNVLMWRARKVRLNEKALTLYALFRQRTIPYTKIETVDLGRGLLGLLVWISGTGTTRTRIAPHSRARELHDKLVMFIDRQ